MSDIAVTFKNQTILTLDASGSKSLLTQGKYCEDDITISYIKPGGGGGGPATLIASGTTSQAYTLSYDFEQSIPELAAYLNKTDGYTPGRILMLFVTHNTSTATTRVLRSIMYRSSSTTVNVDTCGVGAYIYSYGYNNGVANITTRAANIGAGSTYEVYSVDLCSPFPNT